MVPRFFALGLVFLLVSACQSGPRLSGPPALEQKIRSYQNLPADGAFLIAQGDTILVETYGGMADRERNIFNTADTNFHIGSVSKPITAIAVLVLAERGRLSLQDPISKYIPGFPRGGEITIHHLLSQTSGIQNCIGEEEEDPNYQEPVKPETVINQYKDRPLLFNPGEKSRYSNLGFYLLGVIIEKASGQSYEDFLQEALFKPAGLKNTTYEGTKNLAQGYMETEEGFEPVTPAPYDYQLAFSSGAIKSNVRDLHRLLQAVFEYKILSKNTVDLMITRVKDYFGYCWWIEDVTLGGEKDIRVNHSGSYPGFAALIQYFPAHKISTVSMSNTGQPAFLKLWD